VGKGGEERGGHSNAPYRFWLYGAEPGKLSQ